MMVAVAQSATRADAFRSTLVDPTILALQHGSKLPQDFDTKLETRFREVVQETHAQVGLLHRRGEAFFYTVGVHGLERGMHMLVWVSMWDPAIQKMLRGHLLVGDRQASAEHAVVARRLEGAREPQFVLALPVMVGPSVEAILELGRFGAPFGAGAELQSNEIMRGCDVKTPNRRSWLPAFPPASFWASRPIVP